MEDGTEGELGLGDEFDASSGHDAWTIGDEACVVVVSVVALEAMAGAK